MYNLREMKTDDLDLVLEWRNSPKVRENMYTKHVISIAEHHSWFDRISKDHSYRYLICECDGVPVGVIGFSKISSIHKTAEWAFYSGNTSRRGIGTNMEFLALDFAFNELKLNKLSCEVLSFNAPVVSFHRKHGFQIEGVKKKHHFHNEEYHDVILLAIFRKDWVEHCRPICLARIDGEKDSSNVKVGQMYQTSLEITADLVRRFAEVTGDLNPIHLDKDYAVGQGLRAPIAHGMLFGGLFSKILGMEFPGRGSIYLKQTLNFLAPVEIGDLVTASIEVTSKVGRKIWFETNIKNQCGKVSIQGEALVLIPGPQL